MAACGAGLVAACAALAACGSSDTPTVRVPSDAMLPAYEIGDELAVETSDGEPRVGDVVVFHAPRGLETGGCGVARRPGQPCPKPTPPSRSARLMLRVIAGPGDRVAFRQGVAIVNGEPRTEGDLRIDDALCDLCELPLEVTVPPGHWFLAGDNRSKAADSRELGPIPASSIIGTVRD